MKLIRYGEKGNEKPGVLIGNHRRDCSKHFQDWNGDFFRYRGLTELAEMINSEGERLPEVPFEERWAACIARPGMIVCIGLNFSDHAIESKMEIPAEPIIFNKATNTIAGPYDDVPIPPGSEATDYEVELGIVLKQDLLYSANPEEALAAIAGYCVVNDLSERDFQIKRGGQWIKGKSCPGFCPTGPFLVTPDEIADVNNLAMKLSVNGNIRQNGNTRTMIFKNDYLLHYCSQFMQLDAGDLISTGTPPGVGLGMNPTGYLKKGDLVELSIEQLGSQKMKFV